ncbi:MAG: energy transducer TonB [Bacteroidetes bacterium]|nr:energy transducer TonB [Bacteroidota bacterium]
MTKRSISSLFLTGCCAILFWGCASDESIPLDIPVGWENEGVLWWRTASDTTGVFRDLETLVSMGIAIPSGLEPFGLRSGETERIARRRLVTHVKDSLIPLFRNEPDVVDSLFERFVVPKMANARIEGDVRPVIKTFKLEGYRTIARFFREPFSLTKMGLDIPVPIPDSLRDKSIVGRVFMQVYISDEGDPMAIKKLIGVHPVLDRIAIRAMTQMKWQPAYLLKGGKSRPIASWARFKVDFASVL